MKLQNIVFVSLLTLISIELLAPMELSRSVRDLPAEEKQVVNGFLVLEYKGLTSLEGLNEIEGLGSLLLLSLGHNRLSTLPAWIGELTNLQVLNLHSNQLSTLPAEIGNLTHLLRLDLYNNQLSVLPAEIDGLTSLEVFYLSNNQLSTVPAGIGNLTHLRRLEIANNQLSILPAEIGGLTSLQRLNLANNQLSTVPAGIGSLTNLQQLNLSGNQLSQEQVNMVENYFQGINILLDLSNQQPAQQMPVAHNVSKSRKNQHLAQKSTHKKKSAVKVAKRTKKEKVAVA